MPAGRAAGDHLLHPLQRHGKLIVFGRADDDGIDGDVAALVVVRSRRVGAVLGAALGTGVLERAAQVGLVHRRRVDDLLVLRRQYDLVRQDALALD